VKTNGRTQSVILVDTMGELGQLYSAGDFNFVGGSLVNRRGHNIMEAARWGRPVYYGPSIDDFKDAAEILENEGGSFRVADGDALAALLLDHLQDNKKYEQACVHAAQAVSFQQGAAGKQADMVLNLLQDPKKNE
jgi:3-deoxy-D-manno-octulosonic-acid transferase